MSEYAAPLPPLSRYAVMVDVGYIYAAAGELLLGTSSRRDFRVDAAPLIHAVSKHADELVRGELLRVYWYDAARDRVPTIDQRVIAQMPRVKLRLGNLNARGQQKGVDAQIRADMEALARHRAITDAVLVAGDEDMVPAVEAAQAYGVRVHLWGIEPPYGTNQAERLVWESDTVEILDSSFVRPYFTRQAVVADGARANEAVPSVVPSPAQLFGDRVAPRPVHPGKAAHPAAAVAHAAAPSAPPSRLGPDRIRVEEAGEHVAQKWILTRGRDNIRDLLPGPILPPVIDKELLVEAEKELGLSLRAYQEAREWLRDAFWTRVHREFAVSPGGTAPQNPPATPRLGAVSPGGTAPQNPPATPRGGAGRTPATRRACGPVSLGRYGTASVARVHCPPAEPAAHPGLRPGFAGRWTAALHWPTCPLSPLPPKARRCSAWSGATPHQRRSRRWWPSWPCAAGLPPSRPPEQEKFRHGQTSRG